MTWNQNLPSTPWDGNRATWMSQLPDEIAVQDLSVPGTHDSAAMLGFTHANVSVTQNQRIDEQLSNGIRFLDLRVKIMFEKKGLAMYHGADAIYDYYDPHTYNQLYYKTVIQKCVDFLKAQPNEGIIVSVKCEGDEKYDGLTVEDWFRQIANEVAADNPPGTWDRWWAYPSNVNATLKDIRGKMLLLRRFSRGGGDSTLDYSKPFALDLTPMNTTYDNRRGQAGTRPTAGTATSRTTTRRPTASTSSAPGTTHRSMPGIPERCPTTPTRTASTSTSSASVPATIPATIPTC